MILYSGDCSHFTDEEETTRDKYVVLSINAKTKDKPCEQRWLLKENGITWLLENRIRKSPLEMLENVITKGSEEI